MKTDFNDQAADPAAITEFSLGLTLLLACGVFLGSMLVRHADLPLAHLAAHTGLVHQSVAA